MANHHHSHTAGLPGQPEDGGARVYQPMCSGNTEDARSARQRRIAVRVPISLLYEPHRSAHRPRFCVPSRFTLFCFRSRRIPTYITDGEFHTPGPTDSFMGSTILTTGAQWISWTSLLVHFIRAHSSTILCSIHLFLWTLSWDLMPTDPASLSAQGRQAGTASVGTTSTGKRVNRRF